MKKAKNSNKGDDPEVKSFNAGFLAVVLSTFTTVFLAEFGDKTQIATLLLSAQSGKPWIVFLGSAMALVLSSLLAVVIGRWLSAKLPQETFAYSAGFLMISLGIWIAYQASLSLLKNPSFY